MSSTAMASHDENRVQTGLTHRMANGRKLTAVRNRQTVKTACGKTVYKALPVPEPGMYGTPGTDCLSCWPAFRPTVSRPNIDLEAQLLGQVTELLEQTAEIHKKCDKILVQLAGSLERKGVKL